MAKQVTTSGIMQKLGQRLLKAHEEHKADETVYSGGGELPAGLNAIAQLVECKLDRIKPGKDNAGEYFWYAAGVVVSPVEFAGMKVQGLRTSIMEMLCDTPKRTRETVSDHLGHVYNELRKLGVDTSQMEVKDLEATIQALKELQPHFRFHTFKGKMQTEGEYAGKEPRVNHIWDGICDYTEEEGDNGVQDDTATSTIKTPSKNGTQTASIRGKPTPRQEVDEALSPADEADSFNEQGEESGADGIEQRIATLVEKADNKDKKAQEELKAMALAAGLDKKDVANADSWSDVGAMIFASTESSGEGKDEGMEGGEENLPTADEEPVWEPQINEVYLYRPTDPKTKKPGKGVECEVMSVDKKNSQVKLKNLDTGKVFSSPVSWDKLEQA